MTSNLAVVISSIGLGGILGAYAKALFDQRQLRFTGMFEFKQQRYKAILILMWVAMNPSEEEFKKLRRVRPELPALPDLSGELRLEYHNAMLFASDRVLKAMRAFLLEATPVTWASVTRAMRKDLYT